MVCHSYISDAIKQIDAGLSDITLSVLLSPATTPVGSLDKQGCREICIPSRQWQNYP